MLILIAVLLLSAASTALLSWLLGSCATWWFVLRIALLFLAFCVCWLLLYTLFLFVLGALIDQKKPVKKPHHGMRRLMVETMELILLVGRIRVRGDGLDRIDRKSRSCSWRITAR